MKKTSDQDLSQSDKQLRGLDLEKRIEDVIRELASKSHQINKLYIYNASHVADLVPTTRRTLAKHDEFIRRILNDLSARRRMINGDATIEQMRAQIEQLKAKINQLNNAVESLRRHHVDIYTRFHNNSLEAELLIRPILESECMDAGECLFCGTKVENIKVLKRASNIKKFSID